MGNKYHSISNEKIKWDSGGLEDSGQWPSCMGCGIRIKDGEEVIAEKYLFLDVQFTDYWHLGCWEE